MGGPGLFHEAPKITFYYKPAIDPVKIPFDERSPSLFPLPAAHIPQKMRKIPPLSYLHFFQIMYTYFINKNWLFR